MVSLIVGEVVERVASEQGCEDPTRGTTSSSTLFNGTVECAEIGAAAAITLCLLVGIIMVRCSEHMPIVHVTNHPALSTCTVFTVHAVLDGLLNLCTSPTAYAVSVLCHSEGLQVHLNLCVFIQEHLVVAAKPGIGCYTVHDIHTVYYGVVMQK